jgi:hypothetical protein
MQHMYSSRPVFQSQKIKPVKAISAAYKDEGVINTDETLFTRPIVRRLSSKQRRVRLRSEAVLIQSGMASRSAPAAKKQLAILPSKGACR